MMERSELEKLIKGIPVQKKLTRPSSRQVFMLGYVTEEEFIEMQANLEERLRTQTMLLEQMLITMRLLLSVLSVAADIDVSDIDETEDE